MRLTVEQQAKKQPGEVSRSMAVPWAGLVLQNEMTYSRDIISSPDIVSVASWVISNPLFPNVTLRCP